MMTKLTNETPEFVSCIKSIRSNTSLDLEFSRNNKLWLYDGEYNKLVHLRVAELKLIGQSFTRLAELLEESDNEYK